MALSENIAWVYILTNKAMTVLYTGYTTDLPTRMWEHQTQQDIKAFTARYRTFKLLYYRGYHSIASAQAVEKMIKGKKRDWKVRLINSMNPEWSDLSLRMPA